MPATGSKPEWARWVMAWSWLAAVELGTFALTEVVAMLR